MSTDASQIAAFIARNGVTKCPPSSKGARSLRAMRKEHEAALTEGPSEEPLSAEERSEREREAFGRARAGGFSISDALDEAREAG